MRTLAGQCPAPRVSAPGSKRPPVVIWNLLRRCNLTCKHCYATSADSVFRDELDTATALRVIDDLHEAGVRVLILSGGEPLLQVDAALIDALHARGFRVAVESNGTVAAPEGIDWLCISPKAGADWVQRSGQELKLVWPQPGFDLQAIEAGTRFDRYFLQPMDNVLQADNTAACIAQCLQRPAWRLSLQTHKLTGIR